MDSETLKMVLAFVSTIAVTFLLPVMLAILANRQANRVAEVAEALRRSEKTQMQNTTHANTKLDGIRLLVNAPMQTMLQTHLETCRELAKADPSPGNMLKVQAAEQALEIHKQAQAKVEAAEIEFAKSHQIVETQIVSKQIVEKGEADDV